ncbi:hypothetical protein [Thalassotalea fusca]
MQKEVSNNALQFPYLKAYRDEAQHDISRLVAFLKREPAIALTISYFILCSIGIAYLGVLFYLFNINIFPHFELSDFVLGAIHYPLTLLTFALLVGVLILLIKLETYFIDRFEIFKRISNKYYQYARWLSFSSLICIVSLSYLVLAAYIQAETSHKQIISQQGPSYNLTLSVAVDVHGKPKIVLNDVQLVANLSKYLWAYHQKSQQIYMIAHESLLLMEPVIGSTNRPKATSGDNKDS